jgi:phosphate transport system substrate-binding protein
MNLKNSGEFKYRTIGKDLIGVVTNVDSGVEKLADLQLKRLFSGKIKNWHELGGADRNAVLVFGEKIPGTNMFFQKTVLGDQTFAKEKLSAGDAPDTLAKIKATPGGFGLVPQGLDTTGTKVMAISEIGRPITAATKGTPSSEVLKLFEFIARSAL